MGSFPPATALHFQNFSKSYVLHSLTVADFSFSEIFISPPYALHSLTVASLHPTKKISKCQKSFFVVSAFSLDTLHLLQVANFFFKNFSKSPYALHSLQVAMVLL